MQFSPDAVRDLAQLLQQTGLHEISFATQSDDASPLRIVVRAAPKTARAPRSVISSEAANATAIASTDESAIPNENGDEENATPLALPILSTAVGLFALSPDVGVGSVVKRGQVLAIVESLKIPTEVRAPQNGTLHEVFVENAQGVEYGQALLSLMTEV